jgi:hypothetical protein
MLFVCGALHPIIKLGIDTTILVWLYSLLKFYHTRATMGYLKHYFAASSHSTSTR